MEATTTQKCHRLKWAIHTQFNIWFALSTPKHPTTAGHTEWVKTKQEDNSDTHTQFATKLWWRENLHINI